MLLAVKRPSFSSNRRFNAPWVTVNAIHNYRMRFCDIYVIIKVEVRVRLWPIILTKALIILDITKTKSTGNNCFIIH